MVERASVQAGYSGTPLRRKLGVKPDHVVFSSDLDENVVRDLGLGLGFVDVKVAALDHTWSALKFVRRLKDR